MVSDARDGASVYRYLLGEVDGARNESAELQQQFEQLDRDLDDLATDRAETVTDLARHYLPKLNREVVDGTFHGIRDELHQMLLGKQRHRRELVGRIEELDRQRGRQESELEQVTAMLNEKVLERDAAEARVAQVLEDHPQFPTLSHQALQAEQRLARDEDRVEEIRREAEEKLPAYESGRLFRYLYDRGFGTPQYGGRRLTRTLDRWVARLIGFAGARGSYEFLKVTPELMSQEVLVRREQFESQMHQLEQIETDISGEQGLTQVLQEGEELGSRRDRIVADLGRDQEQCEDLEKQLLALDESRGVHYRQAIE
ncbi:MAG: hypothetical protein OER86_06545, partial [Phycisphaerae bacterium]|nr:hypothetical protein [Phycisphaerae bacterium]